MNKNKYYFLKAPLFLLAAIVVSMIALGFYFATTSPHPGAKTVTNSRLASLTTALKAFYSRYCKIPGKSNAQITAALLGKDTEQNPQKIIFLDIKKSKSFLFWNSSPGSLDEKGNYLDAWGSPLLFELNSGTRELLIRSFGPNKKDDGGKEDDIEIRGKIY